MTTSADFGLPQLSQGQATPETTFNEAFVLVQALLNGVESRGDNFPPASPAAQDGDAYIVGSSPTGAWVGRPNCIAVYWGGSWRFIPGNDSSGSPITMGTRQEGMRVYVRDENQQYIWTGAAWVAFLGADIGDSPIYERGTFTPTLTFQTPGDLSVSYTTQLGFYTRIGKKVFLDVVVAGTPTFTTASGNFRVGGFPFVSRNDSGRGPVTAAGTRNVTVAGSEWVSAYVTPTSNYGQLFASDLGTGGSTTIQTTHVASGNTTSVRASFHYEIA